MRYQQYLPGALLVLFAAGLYVAIWRVQAEMNRATAEHLTATADTESRRAAALEMFAFNPDAEQYARRMKILDDDQEQADRKLELAKDATYAWQGYIIGASVGLFIIFVTVMVYTSRKAARA